MAPDNPDPTRILELVDRAHARLLGSTITFSDDQWRAPSRLAGWTRGHVGTHIARQADGLRRLATGALDGIPGTMYASDTARDEEIAAGADRGGEELHTDLDTSAAELAETFDRVGAAGRWETTVTLRGGTEAPAHVLPSGRLTEVVLHHVDLDCGVELDSYDGDTLEAVLAWVAQRMGPRVSEPFEVVTENSRHRLGPANSEAPEVRGPVADVLGWLTGRATVSPEGAEAISPPPL